MDSTASQSSVRIDPYDRVTFILDYWSVIPKLLEEADGSRIKIQGCISRAGAKPRKSSKRLAWHIPQGAWTSRTDIEQISPFTALWREFFKVNAIGKSRRESEEGTPNFILGAVLRSAMQQFDERPSSADFLLELKNSAQQHDVENVQLHSLSFVLDSTLDRHAQHLSAWPFG